MKPYKHLARDSFIAIVGSFVRRLVSFLILPVYTHYLSPESYGLLSMYEYTQLILGVFISLQLENIFEIENAKIGHKNREKLLTIGISFIFFWNLILIPSFLAIFLNHGILKDSSLVLLSTISLAQLTHQLVALVFAYWKSIYHSLKVIILENITFYFNLLFSLILLISFQLDWKSNIFGTALAYALLFILTLIQIKGKWVKIKFSDFKELFPFFKSCLSIIPHACLILGLTYIDRFFISEYFGDAEVGLYALAFKFFLLLIYCSDTLIKITEPLILRLVKSKRMIVGMREIFLRIYWPIAIIYSMISLITPLLFFLLNQNPYVGALGYINLMGGALVLYNVIKISISVLLFEYKAKYVAAFSVSHLIFHGALLQLLFLNESIAPSFLIGIAYNVTFGFSAAIYSFLLCKRMKTYIFMRDVLVYLIPVIFFVYLLGSFQFTENILIQTLIKLALLFSFLSAQFFGSRLINRMVSQWVNKWKNYIIK